MQTRITPNTDTFHAVTRNSLPEVLYKKYSTEKFPKFQRETACRTTHLNKASGSVLGLLLRNKHLDRRFPVRFENFLSTPFYRTPVNEGLMLFWEIFRALQTLHPGIPTSKPSIVP